VNAQERAHHRWGLDEAARTTATLAGLCAERTPEQGSCNTLFEDSYCPPDPRIGVDTISWCWSDSDAVDRLLRLDGLVPKDDHRPLRVVPAPGASVRLSHRLDGLGTIGAFPGASMLYLEGRARALERRDETDHGLGRPADLPAVQDQVCEQLGQLLGAPLATPAVRRIDLTGELSFRRGEDGRELLWLIDQLHSPNHKTSPVREKGGPGIETAYWRTPRRSVPVLRVYDKGVESGTASAGERVRIERQIRYDSRTRSTLSQWLTRDLGALYVTPLKRWLIEGVAAGTPAQLIRLLTDAAVIWPTYWSAGCCWCSRTGRVHQSVWPARKVERVLGTLAVVDSYGAAWPAWSAKQRQRRMAEIRELGLLVTEHPVRVDVDQAVGQLCHLWQQAA